MSSTSNATWCRPGPPRARCPLTWLACLALARRSRSRWIAVVAPELAGDFIGGDHVAGVRAHGEHPQAGGGGILQVRGHQADVIDTADHRSVSVVMQGGQLTDIGDREIGTQVQLYTERGLDVREQPEARRGGPVVETVGFDAGERPGLSVTSSTRPTSVPVTLHERVPFQDDPFGTHRIGRGEVEGVPGEAVGFADRGERLDEGAGRLVPVATAVVDMQGGDAVRRAWSARCEMACSTPRENTRQLITKFSTSQ